MQQIKTENPGLKNKSVKLSPSPLHELLTSLHFQLVEEFPLLEAPRGSVGINYNFHIEVVDNANDVFNKTKNANTLNKSSIDFFDENNWGYVGRAFSLIIGNMDGHKDPIHITVGFDGKGSYDKNAVKSKALKILEKLI